MTNLSFRKCTLEDLETLIEISRSTFIAAFEKDNDPEDFKTYITAAFSEKKIKSELLNLNSAFYFTYLNDDLVGYFKLNQKGAQNEKFSSPAIEVERIYVIEEFQGKQIGKQMLFRIIEMAKTKKVDFLWLGVWEKNEAAIRFYERYHFKKFDTHAYHIGCDRQTDWLLKLELNNL